MKNIPLVLFPLFLIAMLSLLPAFGYQKANTFSWGEKKDSLGIRSEACARYGPSDFCLEGDTLYILDRENNALKVLDEKSGTLSLFMKIGPYADCFAVKDDITAIYSQGFIKIYRAEDNLSPIVIPKPSCILIAKSLVIHDDILYIRDEKSYYHTLYDIANNTALNPVRGLKAVYNGKSFKKGFIVKEDFHTLKICAGSDEIILKYDGHLGASEILHMDDELILLRSEELFSINPIKSREMFLLIDFKGNILKKTWIPFQYYTYFPNNIKVYESSIYYLLSAKEGLHLIKSGVNELLNQKEDALVSLFSEEYHYNSELPGIDELSKTDAPIPKAENPITRSQIISNATPYESATWTATSQNISSGIIQLPDGSYIRTPSWVAAGSLQKVPYKWGGWTSLSTFLSQISAGKYAGDNYTESVSWTDNYCVGVDCSGFVSRAWDTGIKYSTYTIQDISTAYSSFTEMQKGDVVNKASSHVRLVMNDNPSGTVNTIESAGADWRVSFRDFTFTQLSDYVPRYFDYVQEDPDPFPQPFVARVKDWVYTLNIRSGPSSSYGILTTVTGSQMFIASDYENGWYRLAFPSGEGYSYGWCNGGTDTENGYLTGSQSTAIAVVNVSSTLNIRSGPSTAFEIITTVTNGQKFAVLEESGGWYKFSLPASTGYEEGWASGSYIDIYPGGPRPPAGAELISLSSPSSIEPGQDGEVNIALKNTGFSSFSPGTKLKTSNPQNHDSPLYHSSWISQNTILCFNTQVLPFQECSFSFFIHGSQDYAGQSITEYLNLYEDGLGWFSDSGQNGPADDVINFTVDIEALNINISDIMPAGGIYSIGDTAIITWACDAPTGDSMRISIKRDGFPDVPGPDYCLLTGDTPNTGSAILEIPAGINTAGDWRIWIGHNNSGSFASAQGNITIKQPVNISVSDGINPLEGAKILINGTELLTNSSGYAIISLFHGSYNCHISKSGFIYYDGGHEVNSSNTSISVSLTASVYHDMAISLEKPGIDGVWLWSYNADDSPFSWDRILTGLVSRSLQFGDISQDGQAELIADFGENGLWCYSFDSGSWFCLSSSIISAFTLAKTGLSDFKTLIVSFSDYGIYSYNYQASSWNMIIKYPARMLCSGNINRDEDGIDELLISFSIADGIYLYEFSPGTFTRILLASPTQILTADTSGDGHPELICSFSGIGVFTAHYNQDKSMQFSRITYGEPDTNHLMACGDISGGPGDEIIMTYLAKTYYYNSNSSTWHLLANAPFKRVISGLFTGQARDDLILSGSISGDIYLRKTYCGSFVSMAAQGDSNAMCRLD